MAVEVGKLRARDYAAVLGGEMVLYRIDSSRKDGSAKKPKYYLKGACGVMTVNSATIATNIIDGTPKAERPPEKKQAEKESAPAAASAARAATTPEEIPLALIRHMAASAARGATKPPKEDADFWEDD